MRDAKAWVSAAIAAADRLAVGHGRGPIRHFDRFRQATIALPWSRFGR